MARTVLAKQVATGPYGAAGLNLTLAAADTVNKQSCVANGNDLIIAQNTGVSPYTVTITSSADQYGRTKDIAIESLAASEIHVFGPFSILGWQQTDGSLYFEASNAAVKFSVIKLPG